MEELDCVSVVEDRQSCLSGFSSARVEEKTDRQDCLSSTGSS